MAKNKLPKISEKEFSRQVTQYARLNGWLVYHTYDSRRSQAGFPDLVFVRERVIYAELKTDTGVVRPDQTKWATALQWARQEYYLWRPSMWKSIEQSLGRV